MNMAARLPKVVCHARSSSDLPKGLFFWYVKPTMTNAMVMRTAFATQWWRNNDARNSLNGLLSSEAITKTANKDEAAVAAL